MTFYTVTYYCNDEMVTCYESTKLARNGSELGAIERVFEQLPRLPKDIVGVFVRTQHLH